MGVLTHLGFSLFAADEPPIPVPPPETIPSTEKPTTNTLADDYLFDDLGRRDPFTFTKNLAIIPVGVDSPVVTETTDKEPEIPLETLKKIRSASEAACIAAESALMDLDPNAAIAKCEGGMDEFKPIPNLSLYPDLEIIKGRLLRARKAGEQMRSRQTAQRDFDAMNIKISGVMAMPKKTNSQAIINSEIVHKGSMVKASSEAADVMVDEILPERVVFVFRGYRMMLLLSDAGGK